MLEVIAATFPGSRLRVENGQIVGPLQYEGQFHSLRLRLEPFVEIFVDLPPVDGFELLIQWGDRWLGDVDIGDPLIDDAFFIRTNDPLLAKLWLDERARRTLWESNGRRPWTIGIENNRLSASLGIGKLASREESLDAIVTLCAIAGASGRWAQRCSELALLTGMRVKEITDRVELGAQAFLLEVQRVDVEVRYQRQDHGSHARLSTRVRGNRAAETTATWSVIDDDAPRGPIPDPPDGDKVRVPEPLRHLEARCSMDAAPPPFSVLEPLFVREANKALAVIATTTEITVWFDGAVLEPEPIAIAARVIAQLATDSGLAEGPYR